jgi:hypothetical protein
MARFLRHGRLARWTLVLAAAGAAACSAGSRSPAPAPEGGDDDDGGADAAEEPVPTYDPTFSAIYDEILSKTCAGPFCHGAAAASGGIDMGTQESAYQSMVGVMANGPYCADAGLLIVDPGDPDASLFYLKVTNPPCGNKMPPIYVPYLDAKQTGQISGWIAMGAPND